MNTPIFDLMNEIVSDASEKVNNYKSFVSNDLENPTPIKNYPSFMEDRIHTEVQSPIQFNKEWMENPYITEINQSYTKLKEGAESNKLSDTFRSEGNKEIRYQTERSFKKTVSSFFRYNSILQAHS